jgi:hypothetical protein
MDTGATIRTHLDRLKTLRGTGAAAPARLPELKQFQSTRLTASYADIAAQPRYRMATHFFLGDLYGPKDFSRRDASMMRILPAMTRILPASAVQTAAFAIELESLSEELDHRVAAALPPGPIDDTRYGEAYRAGSTPAEREHQIDLVVGVGERLDSLVAKPLVYRTLKLMRAPAHLAGMDDLQDFLERGFAAFREMGGADDFLALIRSREGAIKSRLFSGAPQPFSL